MANPYDNNPFENNERDELKNEHDANRELKKTIDSIGVTWNELNDPHNEFGGG